VPSRDEAESERHHSPVLRGTFMAASHSDSHHSLGPVANERPRKAPGSPTGAENARPGYRTSAASSANTWGTFLVRLLFGAGLAAVVLVLWPVACRLGQLSGRSAMQERIARDWPAVACRQEPAVETETGQGEGVRAVPTPLPGSEPLKWTPHPDRGKGADAPPTLPDTSQADQVFETRLHASEEDLRAELRTLPEVRLLSDGEIRNFRGEEQAAQDQLVGPARARLETARARADAANAKVNAILAALNNNRGDPGLTCAEREAARAAQAAQRTFWEANSAFQRAESRVTQERERIGYEVNLRLHETLKRAAARAGLLLQSGPTCQLFPSTAAQVAKLSKDLRDGGFVSGPGVVPSRPFKSGTIQESERIMATIRAFRGGVAIAGRGVAPLGLPGASAAAAGEMEAFDAWCNQHQLEGKSGTVPTLTQLLQVEDESKRLLLVHELTRIPGEEATTQLAVRAVVDLSPAVRRAAVAGLEQRPWQQYGPVLLRGLRYPWAPVADHAAVALRALEPREAIAPLVDLLDLPSPSAPFLDPKTNQYTVCEVVRLNHLRNCLLCHAPSASKTDGFVRGLVPTPGEALPVEYYASQKGHFVRADTTFVRQDFSVYLPNKDADPWPREQRYDFVTRLRPLTPGPGMGLSGSSGDYPQRGAVLFALRGLTGKDVGESSARWREILGPIPWKPKQEKEGPTLDKIAVSLAGTERTR
jgi:hypothetical protein